MDLVRTEILGELFQPEVWNVACVRAETIVPSYEFTEIGVDPNFRADFHELDSYWFASCSCFVTSCSRFPPSLWSSTPTGLFRSIL